MSLLAQLGIVVIFGIVLLPVYVMLAGWFGGDSEDMRVPLIGVGYITALTIGLLVAVAVIGVVLSPIVPT